MFFEYEISHQGHHAANDARLGTVDHVVSAAQVQHNNNDDDNEGKTADRSAHNNTNRHFAVRGII